MLLFAFSLILAGAAIALAALVGVGSGLLQETFLMAVAALLGGAGFVGFAIALLDRLHNKKRTARLQVLRDAPSSLRWRPPGTVPPKAPPASVEIPQLDTSAAAVAAHEARPEPAPPPAVPAPPPKAPAVPKEKPVAKKPATPTPPPPKAPVFKEVPISEMPLKPVEEPSTPAVAPVAEAPAMPPADQLLQLDPEFELAEVKRVLRIWQMTFEEGSLRSDQIGRWLSPDGTLVELFTSPNSPPYMEIRGPMADELAEFLPQDLPIRPIDRKALV